MWGKITFSKCMDLIDDDGFVFNDEKLIDDTVSTEKTIPIFTI
jgi:hypothetical protein